MSTSAQFLTAWHAAVDARDMEGIRALMAPDCVLLSPVVWSPKADQEEILFLLKSVIETVEGFHYRAELVDGPELTLEFVGTVAGKGLVGIDRITLNDSGQMVRLEVLIRPLNTLIAFAEQMGAHWSAWAEQHSG